jgi:YHS domain-containing protein
MDIGVLKSFLGIVVIGALFYFVLRKVGKRGCCGHSHDEHSQYRGHQHGKSDDRMTKDPVCGMTIEENTAAGTYEYDRRTYYFCAVSCRERFEKEPDKYIKDAEKQLKEHHCC